MFNNVSYEYNVRKKTYYFNVWLGSRFWNVVSKIGYPISKQKYLFIKTSWSSLHIHRFFILDLKIILEQVLEIGSAVDINFRAASNLLDIINNDIIGKNKTDFVLDMDAITKNFKYEPLPVQVPAYDGYREIRSLNSSRGMLLDGAVGVGKTYISLSLAIALRSEVVLIIAPLATLKSVWISSISGDNGLYKTPRNSYVVDKDIRYTGEDYIICSYENIKYLIELYKKYNINLTTLIVDEVHNFNDIKAVRTKELMDVCQQIPFINTIPMSGTPIKAKASDLVPLFTIINTDFDKGIEKRFINLYRSKGWLMREVLKERYLQHTIVLKKSDIKIPTLTTPTVKLRIKNGDQFTLTNIIKDMRSFVESRIQELESSYDVYKTIYYKYYIKSKELVLTKSIVTLDMVTRYERDISSIIENYNSGTLSKVPDAIKSANIFEKKYLEPQLDSSEKIEFRNAKTVYKYLALKVQGEALANIVMRARIDCYSILADTIDITSFVNSTVKKTLVFSNYIEVCDVIRANCVRNKLAPVSVYGNTSKHLSRNVNIFINDNKLNPLISTYKSLSTGVPIVVANVIIILGLPHRQYIFEQAVGRAWRTGQDKPVKAYIIELNTDNEPNITDRDFDIIDFFRKEVAGLTGKDDAVIIDRSSGVSDELGISDIMQSRELYMNRMIKSTVDIIKEWFR